MKTVLSIDLQPFTLPRPCAPGMKQPEKGRGIDKHKEGPRDAKENVKDMNY
jgi:hypothetical protein